ncbi:5423_t:CDS:2 [Rhizophagus irregularis]|nr:5423_t:CDS:2 [Rhizophagus irregularis]
MSSFPHIDEYERYEKISNGFTNLNQHSNNRVLDKVFTPKDIISHALSTPSYTSHIPSPSQFYTPCEKCHVPSPFVISQCRRACVMHQQSFFQKENFNHVRKQGRQDRTSSVTISVNDKRLHANLLHDRWNCRWKKDVISQRLEISKVLIGRPIDADQNV